MEKFTYIRYIPDVDAYAYDLRFMCKKFFCDTLHGIINAEFKYHSIILELF